MIGGRFGKVSDEIALIRRSIKEDGTRETKTAPRARTTKSWFEEEHRSVH